MRNIYFFQPQYAVDYRKEKNYWLPYSIGCLWSYCNQYQDIQENYVLADIVFKRESHDDILARLDNPVVCAFSCYQWNKNYTLTLAEKIKKQWPNCSIVFGGPEVTIYFESIEFIDTIIMGEGEISFLDLLRRVIKKQELPTLYQKQRLQIDNYPSPYTSGVFEKIINENPSVKWATTLETNRGCPFSCTFCDWGSVTYSKIKKFNLERVSEDIDWISRNPISYVFCADANFGILKDRDLIIAKMVAEAGKRSDYLESFNATFNKNNNEWSFKILNELGDLNKGFTVSVQSLHPPTLKAIKRDNLGINDLANIFSLCNKNNISSYTELILGLPLETKKTFIDGLCELLELGQHNQIDIWFTDILSNSELASPMDRFNYGIKTVETENYLALLNQNDIDNYPEEVSLVSSTSTMTTDDMIDSYVYGWLIVNFHLQGYSQLTSRYCRSKHNVKYQQFYDCMLEEIINDVELGPVYAEIKRNISTLLYHGKLEKGQSGHNLLFNNGDKIYQAKNQVFDIVTKVFSKVTNSKNSDLDKLQRLMVLDTNAQYPISVTSTFDVETFDSMSKNYSINQKSNSIMHLDKKNFTEEFYALRRKGLLKTIIKEFDVDTTI